MSSAPTVEEIRQKAFELGWDDVGLTTAEIPQEDVESYFSWLAKGYHGNLEYMENTMRIAPQQLLQGAKTAILFVTHYKQPRLPFQTPNAGLIASYARGRDYHNIHRKRLKRFISWLEGCCGKTGIARGFSDSKPILEKALFVKAGLGWYGKNTLLIHRRFGTFILLSGALTTIEFETKTDVDTRVQRCGSCTKCLDACPTQALASPYILNANLCLSYHLIESKDPIPEHIVKANPGYAFGCDICQDVCPHNVRPPLSQSSDFNPKTVEEAYISTERLQKIENLDGTPLKRRGKEGLRLTLETFLL